jgi:hypothetical protein
MTLRKLVLGLTAIAMLAIPAQASAVSKTDPWQWQAPPSSLEPRVGYSFTLYNQINGRTLGYEERTFGINLGWVGSKGNLQWVLKRDFRYGDKLALVNTKADDYVAYGSRSVGINLVWKNYPVYEWVVNWDPTTKRFSLYNTAARDYVVYGERSFGVNLIWLKDLPTVPANAPGVKTASLTMRRQTYAQYTWYTGGFGGGVDGTLRKVTNPNPDIWVRFVKLGDSERECHNPDARFVWVRPYATMTADEMKAAFGGATPRLPVSVLACAAASDPRTISLSLAYYRNASAP